MVEGSQIMEALFMKIDDDAEDNKTIIKRFLGLFITWNSKNIEIQRLQQQHKIKV